ncbi:MAG: GNAT family N-acetyltransferase [Gammaproteobacteria bacterium]|nr:GNAT family N-acetyltransferase [Gammaproteobacteria bacterium]MBI5616554.1 GNAT family N-acetyltransferase [Gammaproteobacteria bacterium]
MAVGVRLLTGRDPELAHRVPELARLRIEVFRDFPYLYAGTMDYEMRYLATYVNCPDSVVVLVEDGRDVVGASTGLPLVAEDEAFQRPFVERGYDIATVFYCGESVLQKDYRGQGLYAKFFTGREQHARALGGMKLITLCGVERPVDHPRRPADYVPLDAVWTRFGYVRHPELATTFSWQDLDEPAETAKPMVFWTKALDVVA